MTARDKRLRDLEATTQQWEPALNPDPCPKSFSLFRPYQDAGLPIPHCEECGRIHDYRIIFHVRPSRTLQDVEALLSPHRSEQDTAN